MNRKLKLLCVTRKYPPSVGGMEKFCFELFSKIDEKPDVEQTILALGKSQKHLIWFLPYCTLYLIFNAHKYDVIYYGDSLLCGPAFFAKFFSGKARGVVDVHGLDVLYPNPVYQLYLKMFYRCFHTYICNSRDTEKILHGRNIKNTVVVTRGVDEEKFKKVPRNKKKLRKRYGLDEDAVVLLTVGRLVERKGVRWFVKNVMPLFKGENVHYLVVGGGKEEAAIREAILSEKLEKQVHMLGKISDNELNDLYVNADIFIMPNLRIENDREGFGIVAIEASCGGLIVMASGIDGIVDAVIDGKNGYLLESGNAKMYEAKIRDYMENTEQYEKQKESFVAYTKEKFGLNSTTDHYLNVFKRSIGLK